VQECAAKAEREKGKNDAFHVSSPKREFDAAISAR